MAIGSIYITNPSEIDSFCCYWPTVSLHNVHVCTRKTYGIYPSRLQFSHNLLVDQSSIDHCHDAQHFVVSNTTSTYHCGLHSQLSCKTCGRASTSMHQYLHTFQLCKAIQQGRKRVGAFNNSPANLYDIDMQHYSKYVYPYKPLR